MKVIKENLPTYLPIGNRKRFVVKKIYDCMMKKGLTFDDIIEIFEQRIENIGGDDEYELFVMETDLTPHIKKSPNLFKVGSNTFIIKIKQYFPDDEVLKAFLIINFSGLVLYMGERSGIVKLQENFETELKKISNDTYNTTIMFDPKFLLWIFMKYRRSDFELTNNVLIKNIVDTKVVRVSEKRSDFGDEIHAIDTKNVTNSLVILQSLLFGHRIISTKYRINFHGYYPAFLLINNEKIYFCKDKFFLKFSKTEEFIVGIFVIQEFVKMYNAWKRGININGKDLTEQDWRLIAKDIIKKSNTITDEKNIIRVINSF